MHSQFPYFSAMRKFPYTEILGWSASRFEIFLSCKRKYFYSYYGKYDPEIPRDKINFLRSLTTISMEAGSLTHEMIETILHRLRKDAGPINIEKLQLYLQKLIQEKSMQKHFFERYYHSTEIINAEEMYEKSFSALQHFLLSDRFNWIRERAIERQDEWVIEPDGFGETRIAGMKAYCKVDCMLPYEDKVYIFDWKTGKAEVEKHRKQVIGYALFAHHNYGFDQEKIIPILAYLKDSYQEEQIIIRQDELSSFMQQVKGESEEMFSYTSNTQKNIPLPKERFEMTPFTGLCAYCEFRELCNR